MVCGSTDSALEEAELLSLAESTGLNGSGLVMEAGATAAGLGASSLSALQRNM